jgi:hypothetical protein
VWFSSPASFNCDGTIAVDGTIVLNNVFQVGNVIWTGPGLLQLTGDNIDMTNVTFAPGFDVQLLGANAGLVFDGACTNKGTMRVMNVVGLNAPDGGHFYNTGLLQIETNCFVSFVGFGASSSFQNTGTIKIPPGLGEISLTVAGPLTNYGVIDVETNSTLDFNNGPGPGTVLDFESGTVFAGPGTVQFISGYPINCDGTITVDGTIVLNSSQTGDAIWTGPGLLQFLAGAMNNDTFAPGFNVQLLSSNSKTFEGACTNEGTMRVLGAGNLVADPFPFNTSLFYNTGLFQIETNFEMDNLLGFKNTGTIKVPPGLGLQLFTINCPLTNSGVIDVETNSELDMANSGYGSGSQTYLDGTLFNGPGTISFVDTGNGGIACYGSVIDNCVLNLQANMSGASTWTGSGLFSWLGGVISSVDFGPGFQSQISGSQAKFLTGIGTNEGTLSWLGGGQLNDSMTSGEFYNSGTFQVSADGTWNNILLNNLIGGNFRQLSGAFFVSYFRNLGSVEAVSGSLNVASNFISSANSSYQVTVNGATPGTNFNQLSAQTLALNGSLQVVLSNGFSPAIGNSFPIMTGRRVGSFSYTTLPPPQSNLMWHVHYSSGSVTLEVAQPGALTDVGFANGTFQFSLNGFATGSYDIQASSNLLDWTTIETNYPFSGSVTVTDTNAAEFGNRFYRARMFP